jgi:hypothetical protein
MQMINLLFAFITHFYSFLFLTGFFNFFSWQPLVAWALPWVKDFLIKITLQKPKPKKWWWNNLTKKFDDFSLTSCHNFLHCSFIINLNERKNIVETESKKKRKKKCCWIWIKKRKKNIVETELKKKRFLKNLLQ